MKRAVMIVGILGLMASLAAPVMAAKGMWGPGYFDPNAPVGVRFWAAEKVAIDVGLGLEQQKFGDDSALKFAFDAGVPFVIAGNNTTMFFVRPGILFISDPINKDDAATTLWVRGSLGVEHFFSDRFSIQAAHGLYFENYDPGIKGSDSVTSFGTEGMGISSFGFHYYLFPKQ